jgi:hypothetical protein
MQADIHIADALTSSKRAFIRREERCRALAMVDSTPEVPMPDETQPRQFQKFLVKCPKLNSMVEIETNDWKEREDSSGFDYRGVCPACGQEHFGFTSTS